MKCEICGQDAPFFTETYDPEEDKARFIYLCEEHQNKMYRKVVDAMLDMGSLYITESEESAVIRRKMRYNYRHNWQGNDCCMNCMHPFLGPAGLTCNVIGGRIYKGDTCSAFKRRAYIINEGTPDERILERDTDAITKAIKESMDNRPIPIVTTPTEKQRKDIAKVLEWLYIGGVHIHGTDEKIEAAIRRIGGEEE